MKIGLIRHFKVNQPFPKKKLLSKSEIIKWFIEYNNCINIEYKKVDLADIDWKHCYSSPMIRAINTANHCYDKQIVEIAELKELDILHRLPNISKLPFLIWGIIVRIQSYSFNSDTNKFRNEIIDFVDKVITNNESDILIVSHWFVMQVIRKELIKRKFIGMNFKSNEYGKLYIFKDSNE